MSNQNDITYVISDLLNELIEKIFDTIIIDAEIFSEEEKNKISLNLNDVKQSQLILVNENEEEKQLDYEDDIDNLEENSKRQTLKVSA
jgi:hypothetical protein